MPELNPKVEHELKDILTQSKAHPLTHFHKLVKGIIEKRESGTPENWQRAGQLYIQAVKTGPVCLLLAMLDELEVTLNPLIHMLPCSSYDAEGDTCRLRLDVSKCPSCPQYVPLHDPWIDLCKAKPCPFQSEDSPCCDQGGKPDA